MNKCMSVFRTVALLLILILTFGFTVFAEPEEGGTEAPPAEPVTQQQEEQPDSPKPEAQQNNKKSSNPYGSRTSADGVKWTRTIDPHDVNVIL